MLRINRRISISEDEVEISAIRAQGAGGQNVNKVSSAIHLRFDIPQSSLPDTYKERLLNLRDHRISKDGIIIIKAQQFRSQEKNRDDAIHRLIELIRRATANQKKRIPTKPTKASQRQRIDTKSKRGRVKSLRQKVNVNE